MKYFSCFAGVLLAVGLAWGAAAAANSQTAVPCVAGTAGPFPCHNVDLLAHLPLADLGAGEGVAGSDHWGWTDPETGRDYVLFGLTDGTAFVDITERQRPLYLGTLPSHDGTSIWRDIKVYENVAYVTADIPTNHGLQLFDLTQLRDVVNPPVTFSETGHYAGFGPGHNLWVNRETGYLYVFRSDTCGGGVHVIDVRRPLQPQFAGCFAADETPLSDAECVVYRGPDADYAGRELCFVGSDDNVSIWDVTEKADPQRVVSFRYPGIERAHQGALTADQRTWLLSDTMDEEENGHATRTYIFDVSDVDAPVVVGFYSHETAARDHNLYLVGDTLYETNWQAGLRVLDVRGRPQPSFLEVGYFDTAPQSDSVNPEGAWSSYPWWGDGVVTVSDSQEGLFVLRPFLPRAYAPLVR